MRNGFAAALAGALVVLPAFVARDARAQDADAEPLGVDYAAPEGCPPASSFFAEITARTPRARAMRSGERARVLHVRLTRRGEGHVGTLAIEDTSGTGSAREVSGGTCAEVVGALALVAALAVDPRASVAPRPPPTPTPTQASEPAPKAAAPVTEVAAPLDPARDRLRTREAEPRDDRPRRARFGLGAAGEIAMIADAVVSIRVFGDLEVSRGTDDKGLFAPSFRLAAARSLDRNVSAAGLGAKLRWTQAGLDACPFRLAFGARAGLRTCAAAAAGILQAEGLQARTRPWASLGAHVRLVWSPAAVLDIEAEAGGITPLYRESFFFEPNVPVYEAPVAAFVGRFGASLRFP